MHVTCPTCSESFPIAAGFLEPDGKRFGVLLAGMDPALGRATVDYLGLFSPARQKLRLSKAVKLVEALDVLTRTGIVSRDERTSASRPTTVAMWVEGIQQMLAQRARLTLPLQNHHYLRSVVYGIADQADAQAERSAEANKRAGRHLEPGTSQAPTDAAARQRRVELNNALMGVDSDMRLGLIKPEEAEVLKSKIRAKFEAERRVQELRS